MLADWELLPQTSTTWASPHVATWAWKAHPENGGTEVSLSLSLLFASIKVTVGSVCPVTAGLDSSGAMHAPFTPLCFWPSRLLKLPLRSAQGPALWWVLSLTCKKKNSTGLGQESSQNICPGLLLFQKGLQQQQPYIQGDDLNRTVGPYCQLKICINTFIIYTINTKIFLNWTKIAQEAERDCLQKRQVCYAVASGEKSGIDH